MLDLPNGRGLGRKQSFQRFADAILEYNKQASQPMSSRGWCYFLEGFNAVTKGNFDKVQYAFNECRKRGLIPIDIVVEDQKRVWQGIETPNKETPEQYLKEWLEATQRAEYMYTPDWWNGEKYYTQAMVEKIDLVYMFQPVFKEYHIPIVNAGGWYDIMERAQAAKRFSYHEENGRVPLILYFGDFDPWGLKISEKLKKAFLDIYHGTGWNPKHLIVDRFGLNFNYIEEQGLTWIDNLESGRKRDMSQMKNKIVQDYIVKYGIRKCEANAVMRASARESALELCVNTIEKYLGTDAQTRFNRRRKLIVKRLQKFKSQTGLDVALDEALRIIETQEEE